MQLRRAVLSDWKAISKMDVDVFAEKFNKKDYVNILKSHNACNFVFTNNESLVGYILCTMIEDSDFHQTVAYISSLAVYESYQRQGIASRLMNSAIEAVQLLQSPVHVISLHVRINNHKAVSFYRKQKFVKVKTLKHYYNLPQEDAFLMARATCLPVNAIY